MMTHEIPIGVWLREEAARLGCSPCHVRKLFNAGYRYADLKVRRVNQRTILVTVPGDGPPVGESKRAKARKASVVRKQMAKENTVICECGRSKPAGQRGCDRCRALEHRMSRDYIRESRRYVPIEQRYTDEYRCHI